tara:strand:- start:295 stop:621 length:327 start_codon:yes stop_codon:yes gene_type:complete
MNFIDNHNNIEYSEKSTNIFGGGLNCKTIIKNNYILSNMDTGDEYDRFKDLYVPVGLQKGTYTYCNNSYENNDSVVKESLYDKLYNNVNTRAPKNPLNKTQKKKNKKS